jgi:TRAP-type uncharacterized transport system fused permease subunit
VYFLLIAGTQVLITAIYTTVAMILLGSIQYAIRHGATRKAVTEIGSAVYVAFRESNETIVRIGVIGAAIGVIVKILTMTAAAQGLALLLLDISGESLLLLLVLTMVLAIILGMGAPTVAAYLMAALILSPSLTQMGIADLQAHYFVFYFAVLSYITPPIAISVAIAANLAESDFIATAIESMKLAAPLYILPYLFIFYDLIPADPSGIGLGLVARTAFVLALLGIFSFFVYSSRSRVIRASGLAGSLLILALAQGFV